MEKGKNIMIIKIYNLKVNIEMGIDGMEKDIIIKEKKFLR